jgi:hypothetical protein
MAYVTHDVDQEMGKLLGHPLSSNSQLGHIVVRQYAEAGLEDAAAAIAITALTMARMVRRLQKSRLTLRPWSRAGVIRLNPFLLVARDLSLSR